MTKKDNQTSSSEKAKEDWMNSKWRPMMGWTYMITCIFDFVLAPVLWSLTQSLFHGSVQTQWQPLTLQGAGLFHVAMGAVLGIAAYGLTQEKLNGANNGGVQLSTNGVASPNNFNSPAPNNFNTPNNFNNPNNFNSPAPTGFGGGFNSPAPAPSAPVMTGFGGKKAPIPAEDPLL